MGERKARGGTERRRKGEKGMRVLYLALGLSRDIVIAQVKKVCMMDECVLIA